MLKQEHQEIIHSIDRALDSVARTCERPSRAGEPWPVRPPMDSSPVLPYRPQSSAGTASGGGGGGLLSSASDLDQLVRRVQAAIGEDPPRSPEFRRYFTTYSPFAAEEEAEEPSPGHSSEMSLASQEYLRKYGLMPASPTHRIRSTRSHQPVRPSKLTYGQVYETESSPPYHSRSKQQRHERELDELENMRILPNI